MTLSTPSSPASSVDSLFDDGDAGDIEGHVSNRRSQSSPPPAGTDDHGPVRVATRSVPPIDGLYVFPELLPGAVANTILEAISDADHFAGGVRDQVMLFTAPPPCPSSMPAHIRTLDKKLAELLAPHLPADVAELAFSQHLARQAILNLYPPGHGITPHVDLPGRYADGIVGVSLAGGCVMTLERVRENEEEGGRLDTLAGGPSRYDVYLPPRTVYVLSGPARWAWSHGIPGQMYDLVRNGDGGAVATLPRSLRVSVTLRWMKDGAEVLS